MKNVSLGLILIGLVIGLVSALAEQLGLGEGDGFGYQQWAGTIAGALLLMVGLVAFSKTAKTA